MKYTSAPKNRLRVFVMTIFRFGVRIRAIFDINALKNVKNAKYTKI